jgi:hypothetical protein
MTVKQLEMALRRLLLDLAVGSATVSVTESSGEQRLLDIREVQFVAEVNEVVIFTEERRG